MRAVRCGGCWGLTMVTIHIFTQQGKIGPVDTAALCSAVT